MTNAYTPFSAHLEHCMQKVEGETLQPHKILCKLPIVEVYIVQYSALFFLLLPSELKRVVFV